MELLILFSILFAIKLMFPKKTLVRVYLIITMAVEVFEGIGAWFALLGFQSRRIGFTVCFIAPSKVLIVIRFIGAITLDVFSSLDSA